MAGDVVMRIGMKDYITLQLKSGDPSVGVDLSQVTKVELRLWESDNVFCWKTTDTPQKLFVISSFEGVLMDGLIQLRPDGDELDSNKCYSFLVIVTDSVGDHSFPIGVGGTPTEYSWDTLATTECPSP
jgi:hypothetical protein